ncbi:transcription factor RADIALIS-like [Lotus japonicus]|uniref:transcription factor RADIALIS-like n=1 Tax=Lotus japonicus TaxID=34305 RepID=UPI00258904B6|nr:transcription factor RADIALIS-like [Lotus japonicus]
MSSSSTWTFEENKKLEEALAIFEEATPDRWEKIAEYVGGKTPEEVKNHCEELEEDTTWTFEEDKAFEEALADFDEDTHDRWVKIAQRIGSKTPEEVKKHYDDLEEDMAHIDSDDIDIDYPNWD